MRAKVSVIIPVYKVAAFIGRCAASLLGQTLDSVEYIFVDDCSPDDSIDVLRRVMDDYPQRANAVRILRHDVNRELPAERNTGLAVAEGDYVFHCDSDDWVETDMLEQMYDAAVASDADVVWSDFFMTFSESERYMPTPAYPTPREALHGLLSGRMKYNVWNKLVRRSLYTDNEIAFPSGHGLGEDMTMIRLMACATRVASVHKAFYHYVKTNANAFTQQPTERQLDDIKFNSDLTFAFIRDRFGNEIGEWLDFFLLDVKLPFLITDDTAMYEKWRTWFTHANKSIFANTGHSRRIRFVEYCASRNVFWVVRLHYYLYSRALRTMYK